MNKKSHKIIANIMIVVAESILGKNSHNYISLFYKNKFLSRIGFQTEFLGCSTSDKNGFRVEEMIATHYHVEARSSLGRIHFLLVE